MRIGVNTAETLIRFSRLVERLFVPRASEGPTSGDERADRAAAMMGASGRVGAVAEDGRKIAKCV